MRLHPLFNRLNVMFVIAMYLLQAFLLVFAPEEFPVWLVLLPMELLLVCMIVYVIILLLKNYGEK